MDEEGTQIHELPSLKKIIGKITGKELIPVDLPLPITFPTGAVVQTVKISIDELCDYIKAQINISATPSAPSAPSKPSEPTPQEPTPQQPPNASDVGWYKPIRKYDR